MKLIDILNEADPTFGNAAFADPTQLASNEDVPTHRKYLRLQGKSPKEAEPNTEKENEIYLALRKWTGDANDVSAKLLTKNLSAIKKGKDLYPTIFAPSGEEGTPIYRGLDGVSSKMLKMLAQTTERSDWTPMKPITGQAQGDSGFDWFMCIKPITYTPHREWQSWSYSMKSAAYFANSGMLITKQDSNFYFSTKAVQIVFNYNDEKEVLHYGKTFSNKVYVALDQSELNRIPWKEKAQRPLSFDKMAAKLMGDKK
jgi:hypothetical protein